jgi:ECF sigma factor
MTTPSSTRQEVTQLLGDWSGGDEGALEKLFPLVQPELHRLAHHYMSRERAGHTLQTTAILNEAYLRLVDNTKPLLHNRTHFVAARSAPGQRLAGAHGWPHSMTTVSLQRNHRVFAVRSLCKRASIDHFPGPLISR